MEELRSERPTKKQQKLLEFINQFVVEHGYGPSYREIMVGCNYTSVATVAVHVKNLIARGHLIKNGRSARSLKIVGQADVAPKKFASNEVKPAEEKWLIDKIDYIFKQTIDAAVISESDLKKLETLMSATRYLGLEGAYLKYHHQIDDINSTKEEV